MTIRIAIPFHLRTLAGVHDDVAVDLPDGQPITIVSTLDALEAKYPMLRGTIRDHGTLARRPFLRFHACGRDYSLEPQTTLLPPEVASGKEPFLVIGGIAGG